MMDSYINLKDTSIRAPSRIKFHTEEVDFAYFQPKSRSMAPLKKEDLMDRAPFSHPISKFREDGLTAFLITFASKKIRLNISLNSKEKRQHRAKLFFPMVASTKDSLDMIFSSKCTSSKGKACSHTKMEVFYKEASSTATCREKEGWNKSKKVTFTVVISREVY